MARILCAGVLAASLAFAPAAHAQDAYGRGGVEIGAFAGYLLPDEPDFQSGEEAFEFDESILFGGRLGYVFPFNVFLEAEGLFASPDIARGSSVDEVDLFKYGGSLGLNLQLARAFQFYLLGGAGAISYDIPTVGDDDIDFDETDFSPHFGAGFRIFLGPHLAIRLDARDHLLTDGFIDLRRALDPGLTFEDDAESVVHNLTFSGGLSLFLGGDDDADDDGVPNDRDACPSTPAGVRVDMSGCPVDTDGDGVADHLDSCPNTPRVARVDRDGCPTDEDGDGVFDGIDECSNTPPDAQVDARGCPRDADGDGVADGIDACPNTPAGAVVGAEGCPMDRDGDGVFDGLDDCPNTPAGTRVDASGCEVPETEVERQLVEEGRIILHDVKFDFDRASLRPESLPILDEVGRALERHPELRIEIQGHTDWIGSDQYNLQLSQRRAQAVLDYMLRNFPGLEPGQYTTRGYGESRPIATNETDAGRQENRRVEFVVLEGPENIRGERPPLGR